MPAQPPRRGQASFDAPFRSPRHRVWRAGIACCVALCLASTIAAQHLPAGGSAEHLWVVQAESAKAGKQPTYNILHRHRDDAPGSVRHVYAQSREGKVVRQGVAAAGDRLWLVFDGGDVWSVRADLGPADIWQFKGSYHLALPGPRPPKRSSAAKKTTTRKAMPRPQVRSLVAGDDVLWALVRIEDASTLEVVDALPSFPKSAGDEQDDKPAEKPTAQSPSDDDKPQPNDDTNNASDDNDDKKDSPDDQPTPIDEPKPTKRPSGPTRVDRLLRLDRFGWSRVALPDDWSNADAERDPKSAWLLLADPDSADDGALPMLLTPSPTDPAAIRLCRLTLTDDQPTWTCNDVPLPTTKSTDDATPAAVAMPVVVDRQIVVAQRVGGAEKVEVDLALVRPDRVLKLGRLSLDGPTEHWTLTPAGREVALVGSSDKGALQWSRIDLLGEVTLKSQPLKREVSPIFTRGLDMLVLIILLALLSPILIMLWRRDPNRTTPKLPEGIAIGELGARIAAFAIDLVPSLLLMVVVFKIKPGEIPKYWPAWIGRSPNWIEMLPGVYAIGLFVLHTGVMETFTGASVGKRMLKLRVVDLDGKPPNVWQVLSRGVFKAIELALPFTLVLPLLSASRQRLGDAVARTVVVTGQAVASEKDEADDADGDGD